MFQDAMPSPNWVTIISQNMGLSLGMGLSLDKDHALLIVL